MQKVKFCKKIVSILLILVISISPILFSGCSWDLGFNNNQNNSSANTQPSGGNGGSSSGSSSGGSSSTVDPEEEGEDEEEYRESLEREEYDNFFKNYRITYQTDSSQRAQFNSEIINQNNSVSEKIIGKINDNYFDSSNSIFLKSNFEINESTDYDLDGKVLVFNKDDEYNEIKYNYDSETSSYTQYFSHYCKDSSGNIVWNGLIEYDDSSNSEVMKNKITIALTLIQQGNDVVDESGNFNYEFQTLYQQNVQNLLNGNTIKDVEEFNLLANSVSHLGYTDRDAKQLEYFILYYLIGENQVEDDNKLFVNCYFDSAEDEGNVNNIKIKYYAESLNPDVSSSKFNKFLNDETFATGYVLNGDVVLSLDNCGISDENNENDECALLEGVLYYATNYLASIREDNYSEDGTLTNLVMPSAIAVADPFIDDNTIDINPDEEKLSKGIYDKMINTSAILNPGENIKFNGNVWRYDSKAIINSSEAKDYVIDDEDHVLFSIRLPGFKNYVNTVHLIVQNIINSKKETLTEEEMLYWRAVKGIDYPYVDENGLYEEYPNIPYTYFADYDNSDMLFDGETGVAKMFSGFQCYQNMVLMPQADVELEMGALFIVRNRVQDEAHYEDGTTDHSGDFDITVYARYYDAYTNSYATWVDEESGTESEFYKIGTKTVEYIECPSYDEEGIDDIINYEPTTFDFSVKDILYNAMVGGIKNDTNILKGFSDDTELSLHNTELVSKENYGWWFKEISTPDGNNVVVFDGQKTDSPSYFELVFSCSRDIPFQFCFYPSVAYNPEQIVE